MRALPTAWLAVVLALGCAPQEELPPGSSGGGGRPPGIGPMDTGDDSTGGAATGSGTDFDCGDAELGFTPLSPHVLLVLDASGSMMATWLDGTAEVTRWHTLYQVVEVVVGAFDAQLYLGALVFPDAGHACDAPAVPDVDVAPSNGATILAKIPGPDDEVAGGTPTAAAVRSAASHLVDHAEDGPGSILLVTDGYPSCEGPDAAVGAVREAHDVHEIDTYVVGIAIDAESITILSELAEAGGAQAPGATGFFHGDDPEALEQALQEVASSISSCRAKLPREAGDPDALIIRQNGNDVPRVNDCEEQDGWAFVDADGPYDRIDLCGRYCDDVDDGGFAAVFPCTPGA